MKALYPHFASCLCQATCYLRAQKLPEQTANTEVDLGLAQILPMYDDDTEVEPKIISASFADPFILLLRDDSSIFVAQCDDNNELEEIEREDDALLATKWLTGCLYTDSTGVFTSFESSKGHKAGENVVMFLLSAGGALHVSVAWANYEVCILI